MRIDIAIPELNVVADKYCQELECDGSSSILSYYMSEIGVQHQAYVGAVYFKTKKFEPHFWIEAGDYIIDFKTRMWLGKNALEGIFLKSDLKQSKMSYRKSEKVTLTSGKMLLKLHTTRLRHAEEMREFESHLGKMT